MGLDSFLREIENKINGITEGCNNSINSVKNQITEKTDKYINENFNDIRYSSDNINKCINDGIDKLFDKRSNIEKKKLVDSSSFISENSEINKSKVDLKKK